MPARLKKKQHTPSAGASRAPKGAGATAVDFEGLLSDLSAAFVRVSVDEIDREDKAKIVVLPHQHAFQTLHGAAADADALADNPDDIDPGFDLVLEIHLALCAYYPASSIPHRPRGLSGRQCGGIDSGKQDAPIRR